MCAICESFLEDMKSMGIRQSVFAKEHFESSNAVFLLFHVLTSFEATEGFADFKRAVKCKYTGGDLNFTRLPDYVFGQPADLAVYMFFTELRQDLKDPFRKNRPV